MEQIWGLTLPNELYILSCMCMNAKLHRIVGFAAFLFLSLGTAFAEKVEVDGIYYNLNGDGTAEVTFRGDMEDGWMYFSADELYGGNVIIPDQILYEGLPYDVVSIGNDAFAGSKYMLSLTLPASVTKLGTGLFSLCSNLCYIEIDEENPSYFSMEGIMYQRNPTAIYFVPKNIQGDISLHEEIREIPSSAFQSCGNLTSIVLPDGVKTIADGAFNNCQNLVEIAMGEAVESIGEYAFSKCYALTVVDIPSSVKSIKSAAFTDCKSLTYILLHEGLQTIGKMAFYNCGNLSGVQLPSTLTSIGDQAFKECVSLDVVKNDSKLAIELGSSNHGYVAYYASQIISDSQSSVCVKNPSDRLSLCKEGGRWMVLNAGGEWVSIYTLTGQLICRVFCANEKEEIPVESPRIVAVLEER